MMLRNQAAIVKPEAWTPAWATLRARIDGLVTVAAKEAAFAIGVSERDLLKQLWLHLPRFSPSEIDEPRCIREEARRLAERLLRLRAPFAHWESQPDRASPIVMCHSSSGLRNGAGLKLGGQKAGATVRTLHFATCADEVARVIHERFHYIGSFRRGHHLGLFPSEGATIPLAMLTLSPMDIRNLDSIYPTADDRSRVLVLSRLFAFDRAPRNSISYLMGQAFRWIHAELPEIDMLLTYLNPNLGFTGAAYQASNWSAFVDVPTRYAYLAGNYITYRTLLSLPAARRRAVRYSQYELEPLKILRYGLARRLHPDGAAAKRELPAYY